MLLKLTLNAESGSTTYNRTYFKDWVHANADCQYTRAEVASEVDIDYMVALKEAWGSAGGLWSVNNRARYANDLGSYATLVAVTDNVNSSKGDRTSAGWLPPSTASRCAYALQRVTVKYRWLEGPFPKVQDRGHENF